MVRQKCQKCHTKKSWKISSFCEYVLVYWFRLFLPGIRDVYGLRTSYQSPALSASQIRCAALADLYQFKPPVSIYSRRTFGLAYMFIGFKISLNIQTIQRSTFGNPIWRQSCLRRWVRVFSSRQNQATEIFWYIFTSPKHKVQEQA